MRSVGRFLVVVGSFIAIWQASLAIGQAVPSIWYEDVGMARRVATETNRLLLIHFWAEWCRPCRQMEAEVFSRPDVLSALATNYVAVKVNFDRAPELVREFRIESIPTDVILTPNGEVLQKFVGGSSAERYIDRINQVAYTYQQRRTMVARANTASATPPLTPGYGNPAWSSPSSQGSGMSIRPMDQPPTMAMNAGSSLPQSGPGNLPPHSQGYFTGQPLAPSPASMSYGQAPAGPFGFVSPQNQVIPPSPPVGSPAWGSGTPLATTSAPPASPADTSLQMMQGPNQSMQSYTTSLTRPAGNLGPSQSFVGPSQVAQGAPSSPPVTEAQPPAAPVASAAPVRQSPKPKVEIPPGNPPLALEGYCPVSLTDKQRWVLGNPRWGARHEGRTYLFAGPEEQQKFLANPDRYAPVLSGMDVVQLVESTQLTEGRREYGAWFGGRVYLFSSEESYQKFSLDPYRYINGLPQAVARLSQQIQGEASLTTSPGNVAASNVPSQSPVGVGQPSVGNLPLKPPVSTPTAPSMSAPTNPPVDTVGGAPTASATSWAPPPTVNIQLPPSVQAVANGTSSPDQPRWPVAQRPRW